MFVQFEDSCWAWEVHKVGVHWCGVRFGGCECEWACGLYVEEEVLEDGSKTSKAKAKGVNCQRKKDLVLVKDVADDCVTSGGDACCWVVLLS